MSMLISSLLQVAAFIGTVILLFVAAILLMFVVLVGYRVIKETLRQTIDEDADEEE